MSDIIFTETKPNKLLSLSLKHPILVMVVLFILVSLIKILDTHILRLSDLLGEAILTKVLGLLLVAAYVWACGRKLSDIGFHRRGAGQSLLIGGLTVGGLFALSYAVQLIALLARGENAGLALTAVDPKSGMAGGLLFGLWLVFGNLVNSAMEEGLFRGTMLRHFRIRFSVWGAILFQSLFFAIWHLNWPITHFITGEATAAEATFEAFSLFLATGIGGIVYGYLYHKTDNLWGAYLAHTSQNTVLNMLFIRTAAGLQSGYEVGLTLAIWLPGYLLLIPLIAWLAKRFKMPELQPWGVFKETTVTGRA